MMFNSSTASMYGKRGGSCKSPRKSISSRENGKLGGRPKQKFNRISFVEYLNEHGIPDNDKKTNGGRVPDEVKYGNWLRKNDPAAFSIAYKEFVQEYLK